MGGGEASKGKELGNGEEQVKDNTVSEGDGKRHMLLQDILKGGTTEVDQEGDQKEGEKQEGE